MNNHDILTEENIDLVDAIEEILDIAPEGSDYDILESEAFLYLAGKLDGEPTEEVKQLATDILTGEWFKRKGSGCL